MSSKWILGALSLVYISSGYAESTRLIYNADKGLAPASGCQTVETDTFPLYVSSNRSLVFQYNRPSGTTPIKNFVIELSSPPKSLTINGDSAAGSFWEATIQDGAYVVLKCKSGFYELFDVTLPSDPKTIAAQVGVQRQDLQALLKSSAQVRTQSEASARLDQLSAPSARSTGSNGQSSGSNSSSASSGKSGKKSGGSSSGNSSASNPSASNGSSKGKGSGNSSSSNGNTDTSSGSTPKGTKEVICADQSSTKIFLRDDQLDVSGGEGLADGTEVTQISSQTKKSGSTTFVKVDTGSTQGWVSTEFLKTDKSACPSLNVRYVCTQDGGDLNFYSDSSMKQIDQISNLTDLDLMGASKKFNNRQYVRVKYGSTVGWVASDYLTDDVASCSSNTNNSSNSGGDTSPANPGSLDPGPVVKCMESRMEVIPGYRDCEQSGDCSGSKPKMESLGMCARFTKVGILNCHGSDDYVDCEDAKNCGSGLIDAGYTKLDTKDPRKAPMGATIIYDGLCGNPAGHIEVKVANNQWISDFIESVPRSETTRCRPVLGIYFKP